MIPKAGKVKASVSDACACFDLKRDAYYKYQKRCMQRKSTVEKVVELVKQERIEQPRVGTRKLHKTLAETFREQELKIGRDALFDILRQEKMLVGQRPFLEELVGFVKDKAGSIVLISCFVQ